MIKKILNVTFFQIIITAINILYGLMLAYYFGATEQMDAFIVVSNFTLTLTNLFTVNQTKTLIPFLSKYKDSPHLGAIISSIFRFNIIVFFFVSICFFFFSQWITFILAPGLSQPQHIIASNSLKILSFFILLSCFCGLCQGLLDYKLKFEIPQSINFLKSIVSILVLVGMVKIMGIYGAPFAGIISLSVIACAYLIIFFKQGHSLHSPFPLFNEYILQYLHLLLPMLLASLAVWTIGFVDTFIASFFDKGSISYLSYCRRIIGYTSVVTHSICVVYYPMLSHISKDKDAEKFQAMFLKGIQVVFTVTLMIALFTILYSKPLLSILFERGNFKAEDSNSIALVMKYYSYVFIGGPFGAFLANLYYARRRMKLVNILSVCSSLVNIVFDCLLGYFFGVLGLAMASSMAFFTGNVLFLYFIYRISPHYTIGSALKKIFPPFGVGILCMIVSLTVQHYGIPFENLRSLHGKIVYVVFHFSLYSVVFLTGCFVLRVEIAYEIVQRSVSFIKKRK